MDLYASSNDIILGCRGGCGIDIYLHAGGALDLADHHRELWSVAASTNINYICHAHYQINFAGGASMVQYIHTCKYSCTARSAVPVRKLVAGVDMNMHAAGRLLLDALLRVETFDDHML
jgi:hypothetical protein